MEFRTFDELIQKLQKDKTIKKVVVVAAADKHTLEAVIKARKAGLIEPTLIGNINDVKEIVKNLNEELPDEAFIDAEDEIDAAHKAVAMINAGEADFIMKGKIQTGDLLKVVVNKEKGLRTGNVMSHIAIHEMKNYKKFLAVTDGGMMTYPDLDMKKQILENAVNTFRQMGYENPKVAVLTAIEKVNPKMPETVDADLLKQMNLNGTITGCTVEGPISYDLTMSKESATIKGFDSPVTGDADIMLVPNIHAGNILSKSLIYSAGAKMAGFIIGAKCPIVLTSRGATTEEKYLSIALCAAINKN
jgi:phosphate butyryltransferase